MPALFHWLELRRRDLADKRALLGGRTGGAKAERGPSRFVRRGA